MREGVPPSVAARSGRPGMPLEMADPDGDDPYAAPFGAPRKPWWRPASKMGRIFLAVGALTILGAFVTTGVVLKTYLERDSRFRIAGTENISATGLSQVSRTDVLPVFGEDVGRNIFHVPISLRRKQLEEIPWVERATVMRVLPDQLRVAVVERKPVAFTRQGQQIGLVDASGVLLSMPASTMAQHHYSFPVLTGIDPGDPLASRSARMAVYERLLAELDANNQQLSNQISEIDLTDPEDARVLMPEQGADILAHFGQDRFLERYQRYKAHISEWRQQYPKLAAVDLRFDQQVVLEMAHGTTAVEPTPGAKPGPDASNPKPSAGEAAKTPIADSTVASIQPTQNHSSKPAAIAPAKSKLVLAKQVSATKSATAKNTAASDKAAKAKLIRELTAKDKAEKERRKRAAQAAVLNRAKGKPTQPAPPTAATREGQ